MNAKEIDAAVMQKLVAGFVDYSVIGMGETVKENNWKCDGWRIVFKRGAQKDFKRFETEYFTGIGLRQSKLKRPKFVNPRCIAAEAWDKQNLKPVAPSAASVLHSLLRDGEAISQSFEHWCMDYGYDSDSINAFETYRACCETGKKLQAFFTPAEIAELKQLTEEY